MPQVVSVADCQHVQIPVAGDIHGRECTAGVAGNDEGVLEVEGVGFPFDRREAHADKNVALLIDDLAAVTAQLGELQALADQLKSGPVTSLYQTAQDSISFEVNPVE